METKKINSKFKVLGALLIIVGAVWALAAFLEFVALTGLSNPTTIAYIIFIPLICVGFLFIGLGAYFAR